MQCNVRKISEDQIEGYCDWNWELKGERILNFNLVTMDYLSIAILWIRILSQKPLEKINIRQNVVKIID